MRACEDLIKFMGDKGKYPQRSRNGHGHKHQETGRRHQGSGRETSERSHHSDDLGHDATERRPQQRLRPLWQHEETRSMASSRPDITPLWPQRLCSPNGRRIRVTKGCVLSVLIQTPPSSRAGFGRHMLATGGNENAARLCGIATDATVFKAHVISGLLAALAAVLWASMIGSCAPETGDSWLIGSFAVSIIGGTGLNGGVISIAGIFLGRRHLCADQLRPD
jgi:Branched-chain amino acid transport system / permease component